MTVVIAEGNASGSQSMLLNVHPAPLTVGIEVSNVTGSLPRTVTFTAVIGGGTGTFRSVDWRFGDGGSGVGTTIQYSYVRAGDFQVTLAVTDSSGAVASASVWENVSTPPSGPMALDASTSLILATAFGAMVVGVAGGILVGRWGRARASHSPGASEVPASPGGGTTPPADAGGAAVPAEPPRIAPGPAEARPTVAAPEDRATPARSPTGPISGPPTEAAAAEGAAPASRTALYLSQRIVLHLAQLGTLGPSEVAPVGFSQLGISQALQVRQNALTNVLRRLVAAGALTEDVRHVRGQPRRLKVYRLSALGESLAHDLRAQGLSLDGDRAGPRRGGGNNAPPVGS